MRFAAACIWRGLSSSQNLCLKRDRSWITNAASPRQSSRLVYLKQEANRNSHERFSSPTRKNLHFYPVYRFVCPTWKRAAQQRNEKRRVRAALAGERAFSCLCSSSILGLHLAGHRLPAGIFCRLHACSDLGGL